MTVVARFKGGPRDGNKNTLKGSDLPPLHIPVPANEAKAINIAPGRYNLHDESDDGMTGYYVWQTLQIPAKAQA